MKTQNTLKESLLEIQTRGFDHFRQAFDSVHENLEKVIKKAEDYHKEYIQSLEKEIAKTMVDDKTIIGLSFSGKVFKVSAKTLRTPAPDPNNEEMMIPHYFTAITTTEVGLEKDENGNFFIDRDHIPFKFILKYLRAGCIIDEDNLPKKGSKKRANLIKECDYYSLNHLKKYLEENKYDLDSKILIKDEDIESFVNVTMFKEWKLLFRASRDGFQSAKFHEKCDGVTKTPTVVLTTNGLIFGGYNHLSWDATLANYKFNENCFLFTINHPDGARRIGHKLGATAYSIYNNNSYGPTFGGGHDLFLSDSCNSITNSCTKIGHTYQNFGKNHYLNNGVQNFQVSDYEVFYM